MALPTRVVRRALVSKLGFSEDRSGRHPLFERWHEGQIVAVTHISHGAGGQQVSDGVLASMARQLGVPGPELRGAISCAISGEEFIQLLLS